jgi:putative phosphoesterase
VNTIGERILGILSDTHGLLREAVLEKLRPCELIIHAGDIGDQTVINQLRSMGNVIAVRGNVDRGPWSADLKEWEYLDFHGKTILVIHDISHLRIDPKAANVDVVIYGHSHIASKEFTNGVLYLNPGSAGPRRFTLPTSIAHLRLVEQHLIPEIITIEEN